MPNELSYTRVAVVAGRVTGNAVQRNRAKRIMRAVLNDLLPEIIPGWDLVLIARRPMENARFIETHACIKLLLGRAHILVAQSNHE